MPFVQRQVQGKAALFQELQQLIPSFSHERNRPLKTLQEDCPLASRTRGQEGPMDGEDQPRTWAAVHRHHQQLCVPGIQVNL